MPSWMKVVTLLALQVDPEVLPPPPTDAAMLAALVEKRPGARVLTHQAMPMAEGRRKICGTAEITGHIEPFTVITNEGNRTSVLVTPAGEQPPARAADLRPRHWELDVFGPGAWAFVEDSGSNPHTQKLDAFQRQLALRFCPMLQPPTGAAWRTAVQQD